MLASDALAGAHRAGSNRHACLDEMRLPQVTSPEARASLPRGPGRLPGVIRALSCHGALVGGLLLSSVAFAQAAPDEAAVEPAAPTENVVQTQTQTQTQTKAQVQTGNQSQTQTQVQAQQGRAEPAAAPAATTAPAASVVEPSPRPSSAASVADVNDPERAARRAEVLERARAWQAQQQQDAAMASAEEDDAWGPQAAGGMNAATSTQRAPTGLGAPAERLRSLDEGFARPQNEGRKAVRTAPRAAQQVLVDGREISVPMPAGFMVPTAVMKEHFIAPVAADASTLLVLWPADTEAAVADPSVQTEGASLPRWVSVSTLPDRRFRSMTSRDFGPFRKMIRDSHAGRVAQQRQQEAAGQPTRVSGHRILGLNAEEAAMRHEPIHADTDSMLAFSARHALSTEDAGRGAASADGAMTVALVHVRDRLLVLRVAGRAGDLAWTRETARQWANRLIAQNPALPSPTESAHDEDGFPRPAFSRQVQEAPRVVSSAPKPAASSLFGEDGLRIDREILAIALLTFLILWGARRIRLW